MPSRILMLFALILAGHAGAAEVALDVGHTLADPGATILDAADLPPLPTTAVHDAAQEAAAPLSAIPSASREDLSLKKAQAELERVLIQRALVRTRGNRSAAARLLELSHRALLYKLRAYGLDDA